jgi:pyruvate dehydrogenase E2 component (dihydrolipoamide acetyltransferase)
MAIPVIMPRQGQSVESCIIAAWHFKKGDLIKEGDILLSYETDKASFDHESPVSGVLLEIFFNAGEEVPVLANIAVLGSEGESIEEFRPVKTGISISHNPEGPAAGEVKSAATGTEQPKASVPIIPETGKRRISPRARKMADMMNIRTDSILGSGPNGRIIVTDILQAGFVSAGEITSPVAARTTAAGKDDFTIQKLSNTRRIIAEKMHASLQQSAQLTHHISADARKILASRALFKTHRSTDITGITINDIICFAVTRVLPEKKYLNSHFLGDQVRIFNRVHLGIAVDTERGLMVPVLKNADVLSLSEMSVKLKELAARCRKGDIDPGLLQSTEASFTVSNLGAYGIELFTPVLNLPQTGILGVNTIIKRPADLGEGVTGFVPFIGLSLTYDHRAVDGAPASAFLAALKAYLETFEPGIV